MRIMQILPELRVGGVETGTVDFAKYLTARNCYNIVVSHGGPLVDELEKNAIRHYALPVHRKSLWSILSCIKAVRKIILQERIDIVHARSRVPAWIAYFACRKTSARFVTTCHGHYSSRFFSRVMGWPKIIIVPSEVIGRHMVEDFHVPSENIRVIPRSVDLNRFVRKKEDEQPKSNYVISIVGRITPLKGHLYFLKAMAKVLRSMPYISIWIIGDVPPHKEDYRHELEMQIKRSGLVNHVQFLGVRRDVPQLLAQTDILVLSSVEPESFGRVVLEAQAVGVPVVATRVGGVVEIIDDEKTGILVQPKDPDEMAEAVLRLINDRKLARQLVQNALVKLRENFTLERMASRTLEVYQELLGQENILVIKISSLGDVILVTPSLRALKKKFPWAKIFCLVGYESREVLQRCPYLDGIIIVDTQERHRTWFSLLLFSRKLKAYRFDKIIDFQNSLKSHLLSFLSFPQESYGFNRKGGFLLSHPVPLPGKDLPPVKHQQRVLRAVGIEGMEDESLELWPSEFDKRNVHEKLEAEWIGSHTNLVGINLSASEKWLTKNWPVEYIAQFCDLLATLNIRAILTGVIKDKELLRQVMALSKSKPIDMVGKTTIMELAALIQRCRVFVSPDSAPLHMAAAVGTPWIAVFGPTSAARHRPPGLKGVVLEKGLPCAPCYSTTCRIQTHACMREIKPEEIVENVKSILKMNQ